MTNSIMMSVSSVAGGVRTSRFQHASTTNTTSTTPISSGINSKPQNHNYHHHNHQTKSQHHTRNHRITDYHTEHDTDNNQSSGSPRIGQRSQSLSALQPAAIIQPRMAQLETLEAKMASIEVSLSSATPRRKKCLPLTSPSPSRLLTSSGIPIDHLEGLRNVLRDKENIIRSLRGQVPPTTATNNSTNNNNNIGSSNNSVISTSSGIKGSNVKEVMNDNERKSLEEKLQRIKADTENKKITIKNLKLALDKLDITDNIDVRIQQAELEYQLGREELNLLTLLEDTRTLQSRLDEANTHTKHRGARANGVTVHGAVSELGGNATLLALDVKWCIDSPRFGIKVEEQGVKIEWAEGTTGLKKGDRLVEINGKLLITRTTTRDDLTRLLSACPDPAQLVVLRSSTLNNSPSVPSAVINGAHAEVSALRSELGLVRERAEEAQRAKDGLRADNLRLTHRISYLEEQVSELLETRKHRHHNHHNHTNTNHQNQNHNHNHNHNHHQEQQVRVVTTTAVNSNQNVTNINIGAGDVQVFQKGSQVTTLVPGSSAPHPPIRVPSSPCITASDKYTTDEEQRPDSRRSTDIDEIRSSRKRNDARSVKSLDLDSDYHHHHHHNHHHNMHYAKPRKSLDYTSEPVSMSHGSQLTRKRPTPPKKPIRLSLHRAQSLQSVENNLPSSTSMSSIASTPVAISTSSSKILETVNGTKESQSSGRKRTHRGERSISGLRWTHQGLSAVSVHLHQRQTARWC